MSAIWHSFAFGRFSRFVPCASDGDLVDILSVCCDPGTSLTTYLYNSQNIGHTVPAYNWAEVQHIHFSEDHNSAWYYLTFGSAIWWNVGNTIVFKDHPDASQALLGHSCKDKKQHKSSPHTECELDFNQWFSTALQNGYDSIQITDHYDCACGATGPSSWTHNRLCQTEIIDIKADPNVAGGCSSTTLKAGWAASKDCNCDDSLAYANCNGYGLR